MRTGIVINTKKYTYHSYLAALFETAASAHGEVKVFDMAETKPLHEKYYALAESGCNLLLTLDCAGFELRTENDTLSYNNFGCRMAHILLRSMQEYREELRQQMNFSMFVFSVKEEDVRSIKDRYPNIPNIELFPQIDYKEKSEETKKISERIIKEWFLYLLEEAELS